MRQLSVMDRVRPNQGLSKKREETKDMGTNNEDTKPVQDDFMAMYMIQFCIDTELEVTRTHADCGRKTAFTISQISKELERRMVRNLAFAMSRKIEALIATINGDCASRQVNGDTVSMSIDDAEFLHGFGLCGGVCVFGVPLLHQSRMGSDAECRHCV